MLAPLPDCQVPVSAPEGAIIAIIIASHSAWNAGQLVTES